MRLNLSLVLSIIVAVGLVALSFTVFQISSERTKLNGDHEERTFRIAEKILQDNKFSIDILNSKNVESYSHQLKEKYDLLGIAFYYGTDSIISFSGPDNLLENSKDYISQSINSDSTIGNFFSVKSKNVYQYISPINNSKLPNYGLILYTDAEYIDNIIDSIWVRNFLRWFVQALLVSLITVLIIRWGIFSPINKIVEWVKAARMGNLEKLKGNPPVSFLAPLFNEIKYIAKEMHEAKAQAEEEAHLRVSREDIWTADRLKIEMSNLLHGKKLIVVSNREPYMHIHEGKNIKCIVPASGMITAMEPILKACGGLWIASGTGDADKEMVDKDDKVQVPPEDPKYTLKRLWQTKEEETHYYYGFSNEGLWPLCHVAHTRPTFRKEDWFYYQKVNADFAKAVIAETEDEDDPFILIQDYHFALLPKLIKQEKPNAKIAIFWHIPWPNPESFGICPWQSEILRGMLGADLIGFHTQYHCNNFLETVNNVLESRVSWENFSVKMEGLTTFVKPFPISISFTLKDFNSKTKTQSPKILLDHGITAKFMGIGVDRIDYTKGIVEKFLAIERFLEKYPEYIGKFTFVQIGAPSRTLLKTYSDIVNAVEKEAERINWKYKTKNWKPILLLKRHHSHEEIMPYYSSANLCMVSSLHDGMNLVAKEFVSARNANDGVLILSRFAGASHELQGALSINPYDIERSAETIKTALEMPLEEQNVRMNQMRNLIMTHNIFSWANHLIKTLAGI